MLTFAHNLKQLLSDPFEQNRPREVVISFFFDGISICLVLPLYWVFVRSLTKTQKQHATLEHVTKLCNVEEYYQACSDVSTLTQYNRIVHFHDRYKGFSFDTTWLIKRYTSDEIIKVLLNFLVE